MRRRNMVSFSTSPI